jgi:murein DD-endopeptidase MepM/ murein hydrolase activator NlpD
MAFRPTASRARLAVAGGLAAATLAAAPGMAASGTASSLSGTAAAPRGLTANVVSAPAPFRGTDKRRHLAYEIVVRNASRQAVRLDRLAIRDAGRGTLLAVYRGVALARLLVRDDAQLGTRALPAGHATVILLDVRLRPGQAVPDRLGHRLQVRRASARGGSKPAVVSASVRVSRRAPARLQPPLRGEGYAVIGCCGPPFAHRLAAFERAGRPVFAQRYALDVVQLDGGVATFAGDPAVNASYFVYGDEVVAAAPGRIAATRDGVPDNTPPGAPGNVGLDDLVGNFVNQELGDGSFALYAHLQPSSLRVRPGDVVQRGQVLGLVGNSGNSSEPHLHFHVMDAQGGSSNLIADGLPFVFDAFTLQSRITGLDADPPAPVRERAPAPAARTGQYPLTGDVLGFAG